MKTKICTKCKKELPMNSDYFHRYNSNKDGFNINCKVCLGYNYTKKLKVRKGYKKCSKCGFEKPMTKSYFYKEKRNSDGYRGQCKKCMNESTKEYRKDNIEKMKEYEKEYRKSNKERIREYDKNYQIKNKKRINEYDRVYYEKNKDRIRVYNKKYYKENKDKLKGYYKEYSKNNPHIYRRASQIRLSKKKKLPHTLTTDEYEDTLRYFNNVCAYCGMSNKDHLEEYGESLHQEHIIPLSKGGGYVKENIIPSCIKCNSSKSNADFDKWYKKSGIYNEEKYNRIMNFIEIHS